MDAGLIVIATASDLNDEELKLLKTITYEGKIIIIHMGDNNKMDDSLIDLNLDSDEKLERNITKILDLLKFKKIMFSV